MQIAVLGTGYVGLVAGLCFADAGHSVICVDSNREKIMGLQKGQLPFYEPGLGELFEANRSRVQFVESIAEAVPLAEILFIAVGTPELPDGTADLEPTFLAIQEICKAAQGPKLLVLKSTVPIGTSRKIAAFVRENCAHPMEIVNNPEFLKQGAAVDDFLKPDRVVIGCSSVEAERKMRELYAPFLRDGQPFLVMDNTSAEMTKYAANSFLALKISFINELALLADKVGADIDAVRKGFSSDSRINPAFFYPGIGYGGSCFPKDVRALVATGHDHHLDLKLLKAADEVNERQKRILIERVLQRFQNVQGHKFAIWGLSFKPRTDDVRRAPSLRIIEDLVARGAIVSAYDPVAGANAKKSTKIKFELSETPMAAAHNASALLILTEWPQFAAADLGALKETLKTPLIFDGRNIFDPKVMSEHGFEYYGIGRQVCSASKDGPMS
jgi:UDPglucose 6-dehydrogenase